MNTFNFGKQDLISLAKGLGIALIGAALTYLSTYVSGHDFGIYTPIIVALLAVVANAVRKLLDGKVE